MPVRDGVLSRREWLAAAAAAVAPLPSAVGAQQAGPGARPGATRFQIACMTYVYRAFPLQRSLERIAKAGYRFVAWGTEHEEEPGRRVPVLAPSAPAAEAARLARRCCSPRFTRSTRTGWRC